MQWFIKCLRQYADFSGRARRAEYWWFALIYNVVFAPLYVIGLAASPSREVTIDANGNLVQADPGSSLGAMFFMGLAMLWGLALFLPALAVLVRRLHDTDKSGWWVLLSFIPLGGLVLLFFAVTEGTNGPNRYGPDPKRGAFDPSQYGQAQQFGQVDQFGQTPQYGQTPPVGAGPQVSQSSQAPQYGQPQQYGQSQQHGQSQQYGQSQRQLPPLGPKPGQQ